MIAPEPAVVEQGYVSHQLNFHAKKSIILGKESLIFMFQQLFANLRTEHISRTWNQASCFKAI